MKSARKKTLRNSVVFYLNGLRKNVAAEQASMMLADFLRYDLGLTGTKIVCAEGDCGACTVLKFHPKTDPYYLPINACIAPVAQMDGASLITVEALKENNELHPVQKALVDQHASQCGFCTPGFVMSIAGLIEKKITEKKSSITPSDAKNCLTGNLCRCTGYQPIVDATVDLAKKSTPSLTKRYFSSAQKKALLDISKKSVLLQNAEYQFFAPSNLKDALTYLNQNPKVTILGAATDLGVMHNKRKLKLHHMLSLHLIDDLHKISVKDKKVTLGARVTLEQFRLFLKKHVPNFAGFLDVFASPQIKNVATVIGNIANASPIGDTPCLLLALDAQVHMASSKTKRVIPLKHFFKAYRQTDLKKNELITEISFNLPDKRTLFKSYKNANRKDLDISTINLALRATWDKTKKNKLQEVILAVGGVAATPVRLYQAEKHLLQSNLNHKNLSQLLETFHQEFKPISDLRSSAAYRRISLEHLFLRALNDTGILR